jgi:hypothetical protein
MTYIPVLYVTMLTVFVSYVAYIWAKYGVLKSISQSYYELPEKLRPLFTFFCWGFALPAIILGSSGLMFLAGSGIAFVGAAAAFQEKMTQEVHMVGAGTGVLASQLAIILQYHMWPVSAVFFGVSLILLFLGWQKIAPKKIWWIEILAFLSICIVLGITLF